MKYGNWQHWKSPHASPDNRKGRIPVSVRVYYFVTQKKSCSWLHLLYPHHHILQLSFCWILLPFPCLGIKLFPYPCQPRQTQSWNTALSQKACFPLHNFMHSSEKESFLNSPLDIWRGTSTFTKIKDFWLQEIVTQIALHHCSCSAPPRLLSLQEACKRVCDSDSTCLYNSITQIQNREGPAYTGKWNRYHETVA